jgi:hypothetical protein
MDDELDEPTSDTYRALKEVPPGSFRQPGPTELDAYIQDDPELQQALRQAVASASTAASSSSSSSSSQADTSATAGDSPSSHTRPLLAPTVPPTLSITIKPSTTAEAEADAPHVLPATEPHRSHSKHSSNHTHPPASKLHRHKRAPAARSSRCVKAACCCAFTLLLTLFVLLFAACVIRAVARHNLHNIVSLLESNPVNRSHTLDGAWDLTVSEADSKRYDLHEVEKTLLGTIYVRCARPALPCPALPSTTSASVVPVRLVSCRVVSCV